MVRGPISVIVGTIVVLAIGSLVVVGPRLFEKVLPANALAVVEQWMAPGETGALSAGSGASASDYLADDSEGLLARGPIAARAGNAVVFIDAVISGHAASGEQDIPSEITTIRPVLGCNLTPPNPGSLVGHATAGTSEMPLAMRTYNDTHLAAEVQVFVDHYREHGTDNPDIANGPAYENYDVAVTETGAPVYLVLQTGPGARIWNIHLAPGARVERVVLLGGAQAGVANLDPLVPVEVILADGLEGCGIRPTYLLNDGHLFFQSMASSAMTPQEADEKLVAINVAVGAYNVWFRDSFGVEAVQTRAGLDAGRVSVIGPVPGPDGKGRAVFAPISGAKIRTTQDQFFEISGQVAAGTDFASRVRAIVTTFAFGDVKTLKQGVTF